LTRVPCPGGSGAGVCGWAAPASVLSGLACTLGGVGGLLAGGVTGADAGMLETLMDGFPLHFIARL